MHDHLLACQSGQSSPNTKRAFLFLAGEAQLESVIVSFFLRVVQNTEGRCIPVPGTDVTSLARSHVSKAAPND